MSMSVEKDDEEPDEKEVGYLGYGVDLFRVDPWKPTYKSRILIDPLETERHAIKTTGYREIYEDSFLHLSHTLTVESGLKGSYGDFSGSVSSKFGSVEKRTEKRHIQKISFTVSGDSHAIKATRTQLRKLLNDGFEDALATMSPDDLFQQYGTHLINKIVTGGRAEFFTQTSDIYSMTKKEFQIISRAKYKGAGGKIEGNQSTDTTDSRKEQLVTGSISVATIGGSAKGAIQIKDGNWLKWAQSCEKSPAFLGYDEDDGLLPIWELTDDKTRRATILEAYQRIAAKALRTHIISATSDVASRPETRVSVPSGYKLLSGGARNNWTGRGSFLTASFPDVDAPGASADTWRVSGKDHLGDTDGVSTHYTHYFPEKTSVTAFAIALYDPDDIWEVRTLYFDKPGTAESPWQSLFINRAQEGEIPPRDFHPLSESGFVMVGGGAKVHFSGKGNLLTAMFPPQNGTEWFVRSASHLDSDPATISGYLIGLRSRVKGVKLQTRITKGESTASVKPTASVEPLSGYVMTGGGASIFEGMLLTASYPKDETTWEARGKDHGVPHSGKVAAYCIGLKVADS
jgi:MAC/Perforin domain